MFRNEDTVEDFLPTEQYSIQNVSNNSNELTIIHQRDEQHQHQCCESSANPHTVVVHQIGFYGWRKKCLYFFVLLATVAIVINAALTLWIIAVLSFSMDGIGKLKIQSNSLHLTGDAFLLDNVYANSIRSRKDQNIRIQSDNSIIMNAKNSNSDVWNRLFVGKTQVSSIANQFVVRSPDGKLLFLVSHNDFVVATDKLRVNNAAGIKFNGSIQVPLVQSNTFDELNVLSPTRRIKIKGPQKVFVKSRNGDVSANSVNNLYLRSKEKIIHLDSDRIEFRNLRIAYPTKRGRTYPGIYQLCMCADNGKLFIVPPEATCITDGSVC